MTPFEQKVREIFHYVAEYGITNKPLDFRDKSKISEKDKEEFAIWVHKGFRLGQKLVTDELVKLKEVEAEVKATLKDARQKKDKEAVYELNHILEIIRHEVAILRHFMDFIAWQIFKGHHFIARSFFSGSKERPDLLNTNLESVIKVSEQLHKQDENNFALITDLTTFIDIGDILLVNRGKMKLMEIKEGQVQKRVYDFLDELAKPDFKPENIDYTDIDEKFFEQAIRTLNQIDKGQKAIQIVNEEKGEDPFTGHEIKVTETSVKQHRYYEDVLSLIQKAKSDGSAYICIEDIVFMGAYTGEKVRISKALFGEVVQFHFDKEYPAFDYISQIYFPLSDPLFFKPFGQEIFYDLFFNRVKILVMVNTDALISLFISKGIPARWMSKKETHRYAEGKTIKYKPFIYKNRAIELDLGNNRLVMGDAFLIKLMLENIKPSTLVDTYLDMRGME